jgi:hypothetical protein
MKIATTCRLKIPANLCHSNQPNGLQSNLQVGVEWHSTGFDAALMTVQNIDDAFYRNGASKRYNGLCRAAVLISVSEWSKPSLTNGS